jgi:hypothetical protein
MSHIFEKRAATTKKGRKNASVALNLSAAPGD